MKHVDVADTREQLGARAAEFIIRTLDNRRCANIALSGGSTPIVVYKHLTQMKQNINWNSIRFFWSDERTVPLHHPDSNAGTALNFFLHPMGVNYTMFFPMPTQLAPETAAAQYELTIRRLLPHNSPPAFDLILLGLGDDGHTASLFPGTEALNETRRWVAANYVKSKEAWRLTFTYPLLNQARQILFLVSGANKAEVLADVLENPDSRYPAAKIKPHSGQLLWFADREAAAELR